MILWGLCYVGITLVALVLRWLCWYFVGSIGISLVALVLCWLCWREISDSIFWLFYFTTTLSGQCKALPKKVPKRIIQKEKTGQIRDEDVSFILSFIYWVQQPFRGWGNFSWIHWNGWIPQLRCQKYVKSFHVCICPYLVFQASIRVSFLLEVLS